MAALLVQLYRRLDRLQRRLPVRLGASLLVLLACGVAFGALLTTCYRLERQRDAIAGMLAGQSVTEGDPAAVELYETGTLTVEGETFTLRDRARAFGRDGIVAEPHRVAYLMVPRPEWVPRELSWALDQTETVWFAAIVVTAWLLLIVWLDVLLPFLLTIVATSALALACRGLGWPGLALAVCGMGMLTFTFVLLMRAALVAIHAPLRPLAVAHTVIREAGRSMVALVFIVVLLLVLPMLPLWLDPESPLRFQVQKFISRGIDVTYWLTALMTLFLSCATVAFEIRDRQIWQVMTKPVSRLEYLLGKWLGVMLVNLVVLVVTGVSIFTFVQYLRARPVAPGEAGLLDALAVYDEVLTARVPKRPDYDRLDDAQLRRRFEAKIQSDGNLLEQYESGTMPRRVEQELRNEIIEAYGLAQRSVPPLGGYREYVFSGLEGAKELQSTLTLRYRFHILRDDEHETFPAVFVFNDDRGTAVERPYVPTIASTLPIPSQHIRDDGTLKLTLVNTYRPRPDEQGYGALNFEIEDFELLYKVGSFEGNFVRGMLVLWLKLGFLAMLGIAAATFLSFPVACLLSFTIFLAGTLGPYLAQSLEYYYPPELRAMDWTDIGMIIQLVFQSVVKAVAQSLVFLLGAFGAYQPREALTQGELIPWSSIGGAVLRFGVGWSGLSLLVGWIAFRRKQLAIYSGHG